MLKINIFLAFRPIYFSPMNKLLYILFLTFSSLTFSQNQSIDTEYINSQEMHGKTFVGFDNLKNYYYTENNVLFKDNGLKIWEYKNLALGKITSVDLTNPLKTVLFYQDFNTIISLDSQLNETQKINLFELDSSILATKVGFAAKNQFWIYNELTRQVMLFDYINNSFKTIGNPIQGEILYSQTDFNNFYWIVINSLYAVDIYGKIKFITNIPPFEHVQIIDDKQLLYSYNNSLYCYNIESKTSHKIEIVENSFENFYFKDQILAIFTLQQIKNYKIKLP